MNQNTEKTEKTLEQRISDLEAQMTDDAFAARVKPIAAEVCVILAGEVVKIGCREIASEVGATIARPFTWAWDGVKGLFKYVTKTAPAVQTPAAAQA